MRRHPPEGGHGYTTARATPTGRILVGAAAALLTAGCSSSPDTVPPTASAPPCASAAAQPTTTATSLDEAADRRQGWKFTEIPITAREGSTYALGGSWFFAWGGAKDRSGDLRSDGLLVDVDSGEWVLIPAAPIEARYLASAVWTGSEFVVFGGHTFEASLTDGAAYDPVERKWRRLAASPFAAAPYAATVWTGTGMVVWMPSEDAAVTDLALPSSGQLACYGADADAWSILPTPPVSAVDVDLFPTESGLVLVGGPPMHDLGVVGVPAVLTATTYSVEAGSWSRPVLGPEAESGRAFELAAGSFGVLTEDLVVRGIRDDGWAPLTELPESCWWATGGSSNGGVVYLKGCADYRFDPETFEVTTILAEGEEGATGSLFGSAFLATADGRLVVMGVAEGGDLPSGRVIFGVYAP